MLTRNGMLAKQFEASSSRFERLTILISVILISVFIIDAQLFAAFLWRGEPMMCSLGLEDRAGAERLYRLIARLAELH
jgi:hypothetical protein